MRKMYISLLVHEKLDVVLGQIQNVQLYNPSATVIVHINSSFRTAETVSSIAACHNVVVNPDSLPLQWGGDILQAHLSNFSVALETGAGSNDFFVLQASNDLYVRPGSLEYMEPFAAGFQQFPIKKLSDWAPARSICADRRLIRYFQQMGIAELYHSQPEGMFFRVSVLKSLLSKVTEYAPGLLDRGQFEYPMEEIVLPTLASAFLADNKIGRPLVFSEVVNQTCWIYEQLNKKRFMPRRLYPLGLKKLVPASVNHYRIDKQTVDLIRNGIDFSNRNCRLINPNLSHYRVYDRVFGVKRVPRDANNELRKYILALDPE